MVGRKKRNEQKAMRKEKITPDKNPLSVLGLVFGKWILPYRNPIIEAAASAKVVINAAAIKTPKGSKNIGVKERTIAADFVNSKISFRFIDFERISNTLFGRK
jgi:hypothetical protein